MEALIRSMNEGEEQAFPESSSSQQYGSDEEEYDRLFMEFAAESQFDQQSTNNSARDEDAMDTS